MGESHKRHVKQKKTQKSHSALITYDSVYVRYKRSNSSALLEVSIVVI